MRTAARFPSIGDRAGHYESFFLKLSAPGGGRSAWIRHTVHKPPAEPATCALWFTYFAAGAGPRAAKRSFDAGALETPRDAYIRIGDAVLDDGRAVGSVETEALKASWDLRFSDRHRPFKHFPRELLYRAPLPRTKLLSPYPNAVFDGHLEVDGERIAVEGWRGPVGHNWGSQHAERWVWVDASGFEGGSPEDYFDLAAGRIAMAGRTTPWIGNAMLVLDGVEHRLGGFGRSRSTEIRESPTGCSFRLRGKTAMVTGRVSAEPGDFVAWIYADPAGPEHHALNCSVSDLELDVELADAGAPDSP